MRVERTLLKNLAKTVFNIGYEGEKNHVQVVISCPVMFRDHPDAVASMVVRPPQGDLYPVSLTRSGNNLIWDVSEGDVANSGSGTLQLTFTDGSGDTAEVIKTVFGAYSVNASLVANGSAPDPVQSWLDEAGAALSTFETEIGEIRKITTATDADEGKALSPKTVTNGKVTEWEYIDLADPEVVTQAVDDWLDDHPEATTTVQDGAITEAKLNDSLKGALAWQDDVAGKAPVILDNATGEIVTIPDGADGLDVETLTVAIEPVQSGSGDPSPDNVRPISGWTGANVARTGFNVWDEEWEVGGLNTANGELWNTDTRIRSKNFIPINPSTYYFNKYPTSGVGINVCYYDANKDFISSESYGTVAFQTPSTAHFMKFATYAQYGTTYNNDISINYPSTDHDYHPGHVASYTYPFPSQAGTVYGGTLTVNKDGTGKLVVDRANIASYNGETLPSTWISDRDVYAEGTTPTTGAQVVYELAEPITYPLSDLEVIQLLKGTNNIWSDTGNTSISYPADTKLYIDKKLAELQALILEN